MECKVVQRKAKGKIRTYLNTLVGQRPRADPSCLRQNSARGQGERHACKEDFLCRRCLRFFADVTRAGCRKGGFMIEDGAERIQKGAKIDQRRPKWSPKGAKGSQMATKMHIKIDVRKRSPKGGGGACGKKSGYPF